MSNASARRALQVLILVLAFPLLASAQDVTGTITATLGGEERTWSTIGSDVGGTYEASASWTSVMGEIVTISIQGHPGTSFAVEGALSIDATTFGGFPGGCPCTMTQVGILHWTTSSMFRDVYTTDAGEATITTVEPLGDDAYRIEGTFAGTLQFQAEVMEEPDPGDTLEIEGSFVVDPLPRAD